MKKIAEGLRLKYENHLSHRAIATSCGISASTVSHYLLHTKAAELRWPLPEGLSTTDLEARLFPQRKGARPQKPTPDWPKIHQELQRKHVTLALLWDEYRQEYPAGYSYSQFCQKYLVWKKKLPWVMHQTTFRSPK
jgi:transposase